MSPKLKRLLGAIATAVACNAALAAPSLWISDSDGTLGTVNLADGAVSIVGQMRVVMTDIAFDAQGDLWGVSSASALYRINHDTAAVQLVGGIGQRVNSLVFGDDGTLYAAHTWLMRINPATGAATMIGGQGGFKSSGDLAFVNGNLYLSSMAPAADTLYRIDARTGAGTAVGSGIATGAVYGLATDDNIHLYGVSGNQVLAIDLGTGVGRVMHTYSSQGGLDQAFGTAFTTEAVAVIPEPPAAWMLGAGLLLWALRRWRQLARGTTTAA
jgi:hypothetical protein